MTLMTSGAAIFPCSTALSTSGAIPLSGAYILAAWPTSRLLTPSNSPASTWV